MQIIRIYITSWTASFRYPNLISGFQPSLPIPPLSTIYGLISAAAGYCYSPEKPEIGFVFQNYIKEIDLETIYQTGKSLNEIKSNVIKREFLVDNHLWIYTKNKMLAKFFEKPYFQLLLGRSSDLAFVEEIKEINVKETTELSRLKGTILPFGKYLLPATIQALPASFSDTIPRRNIGTKPYYLLDSNYRQTSAINAEGIIDTQNSYFKNDEVEIYWQE